MSANESLNPASLKSGRLDVPLSFYGSALPKTVISSNAINMSVLSCAVFPPRNIEVLRPVFLRCSAQRLVCPGGKHSFNKQTLSLLHCPKVFKSNCKGEKRKMLRLSLQMAECLEN